MPKKSDVSSRIVRAAVALFSRQGYHGTSTREIARLADVSEVTLYRYFEHKEDVFWAALASCFETIRPRLGSLDLGFRSAIPQVVLPRILSMMIDTATFSPELIRLVAVALLEVRGKAEDVCREHLTPLFTAISHYLEVNMENGRVRNLDPAIMTMAIASTVFAQPSLSTLVKGCRLSTLDSKQAIDAYTTFWLDVLVPPSSELL
jgi:AcrR family transcriptional regulator